MSASPCSAICDASPGGAVARSSRRKSKPKSKAAAAPAKATSGDAGARDYWLEKATRFVGKGRLDDAVAVLDRFWPRPADRLHPDRLRWLVTHAPAAAVDEVRTLPPDVRADAATLTALADALLMLGGDDADALLALEGLPADWVERAQHLRAASADLAAGDDAAATAALLAVGDAPAFEGPRRFLRGLAAWYDRDDDQAALRWAPLRETPTFGPVVARLLEGVPPSGADDLTALHDTLTALRAGEPDQALSAAAAAFDALSPSAQLMLARDLPGAIAALGVPPRAAVERVRRALPGQDDRVDPLILAAHAAELDEETPQAVHHWRALAERLPPADRAAVLHHCGVVLALGADVFEAKAERSWWQRHHHRAAAEEYRVAAFANLRAATEADPDELAWWPALINAASRAGRKERTQVLEAYVARFPDAPDALRRAAEACGDRKSWDKGLRYVRRAAELQPHDRELDALQARLLAGKARKKAKAGKDDAARALFAEARATPHLPSDVALDLAAQEAVFELRAGRVEAAEAVRDAALAVDPRPWLWLAYADLAYLQASGKTLRRLFFDPRFPYFLEATTTPPTTEDFEAVLLLWQARRAKESRDMVLRRVLDHAAVTATPTLSSARFVRLALEAVGSPEPCLALALQGLALDPTDVEFVIARYDMALVLKLPADAFATADDDLRPHLGSNELDATGKPVFGPGWWDRRRAFDLLDEIEQYLEGLSPPPPANAPGPSPAGPAVAAPSARPRRRRRDDAQQQLPLDDDDED
ncbi:MAG: hypothetical protein H6704_23800 [Myxococcales bacterium]|nr:hypothetical protein [Myxococcales bacterium]